MLKQNEEEEIVRLVNQFFELMNFDLRSTVFSQDDQIEINITGEDRSYLISDNGETILSLQYVLARMIRNHLPDFVSYVILLDSDGYMYDHDEELRKLAERTIQRVRREKRRVRLDPMNPYDRRIIHSEIARTHDLNTFSEGDGFMKKITVEVKRRSPRRWD